MIENKISTTYVSAGDRLREEDSREAAVEKENTGNAELIMDENDTRKAPIRD